MGGGLQGGVGGAVALVLDHHRPGGGRRADRRGLGADHDDDAVEHFGAAVDEVAQHRFARDRMQGFRQCGLHAGAKTRGEDDGGCGHGASGVAVWTA